MRAASAGRKCEPDQAPETDSEIDEDVCIHLEDLSGESLFVEDARDLGGAVVSREIADMPLRLLARQVASPLAVQASEEAYPRFP